MIYIKKFLASLLGLVIFFLLTLSCTIFIARELMSEDTIRSIIHYVPNVLENKNEDGTSTSIIDEFMSTLDQTDPRLAKQFDEKELEEELVIMLSSALKNLGNPKEEYILDTTSFKEYLKKGINDYEKETSIDIDDNLIDNLFEDFDKELNITKESLGMGKFIKVFEVIYSNQILLSLVSGIVLCMILIFILLSNIQEALSKIKTPFLVHGIITLLLCYSISSLLSSANINEAKLPEPVISAITSPFLKVGVISLGLGIVLMIVAKILKKNRSIENSNNAIENLGNVNYVPNNDINNTPYTGYQNH